MPEDQSQIEKLDRADQSPEFPADRGALGQFLAQRRAEDVTDVYFALHSLTGRRREVLGVIYLPNDSIRENISQLVPPEEIRRDIAIIQRCVGIKSFTRLAIAALELDELNTHRLHEAPESLKLLRVNGPKRKILDVLELNEGDAKRYFGSEQPIKPVLEAACRKYHASSKAELALMAYQAGMLPGTTPRA